MEIRRVLMGHLFPGLHMQNDCITQIVDYCYLSRTWRLKLQDYRINHTSTEYLSITEDAYDRLLQLETEKEEELVRRREEELMELYDEAEALEEQIRELQEQLTDVHLRINDLEDDQ